jgi:hypothetical protein
MQSIVDNIVETPEAVARVGNIAPHVLADMVRMYGPGIVQTVRDYCERHAERECAEATFEANPAPTEQDAERRAGAEDAVLDCLGRIPLAAADRQRLLRGKQDFRAKLQARVAAKRAALEASEALPAPPRAQPIAGPRKLGSARRRRSTATRAARRPGNAKKKKSRRSSDDDLAGIAGAAPTDGPYNRQYGAP